MSSSKTDPDLDQNKKYIDGPVNVARLEGNIDGIKKVIYLFMDYHAELDREQRQCQNIFSTNLRKYFADSFAELNKEKITVDFFMEIYKKYLHKNSLSYSNNRSLKYIWEVQRMFSKISDFNNNTNKIIQSESFKNLRIHYMDIRDEKVYNFNYAYYSNQYENAINKIRFDGVIRPYTYEQINAITKDYIDTLDTITNIITADEKPQKEMFHALYLTIMKIKQKYTNQKVKKIINLYMKKNLLYVKKIKKYLSEFMDIVEKNIIIEEDISGSKFNPSDNTFRMYINKYDTNKLIEELYEKLDYVAMAGINVYCLITDLFMLRRFLDKTYITNGIAYTGMAHSENYIYILLKEFNFKITHISYSDIPLTKLNSIIKSEDKFFEKLTGDKPYIEHYNQHITPKNFSQCSDLTDFPKNFT